MRPPTLMPRRREQRAPPARSGRRTPSCGYEGRSPARLRRFLRGALAERAVLVDQEVEVHALFVGELEEDSLAVGVFEAFAVFLEEVVRAPFALDADQQRVQIAHAGAQFVCARREDAVGRALEEEKCRPRLEQWIGCEQFRVAFFERAQMLLLFFGELL